MFFTMQEYLAAPPARRAAMLAHNEAQYDRQLAEIKQDMLCLLERIPGTPEHAQAQALEAQVRGVTRFMNHLVRSI